MTSISVRTAAIVVLGLLLALATILVLKNTRAEYRVNSTCLHPADYAGPVWIKLRPQPANLGKPHRYRVYWSPWLYTNEFDFVGCKEVILLHKKMQKGKAPRVSVSVEPACQITFGHGRPRGRKILDINEGWVRKL